MMWHWCCNDFIEFALIVYRFHWFGINVDWCWHRFRWFVLMFGPITSTRMPRLFSSDAQHLVSCLWSDHFNSYDTISLSAFGPIASTRMPDVDLCRSLPVLGLAVYLLADCMITTTVLHTSNQLWGGSPEQLIFSSHARTVLDFNSALVMYWVVFVLNSIDLQTMSIDLLWLGTVVDWFGIDFVGLFWCSLICKRFRLICCDLASLVLDLGQIHSIRLETVSQNRLWPNEIIRTHFATECISGELLGHIQTTCLEGFLCYSGNIGIIQLVWVGSHRTDTQPKEL